jgi:hypothetical protein
VSALLDAVRTKKPHAELVSKLHRTRVLHEEKIAQLRRSVEELVELEAQQRRQAIALSPGKRSDVGGATSAPGRTHNRLLDVEKELASHERELAAVWDVIRGEEQAAQGEHIEEKIAEALAIKETEREAWQTVINAFVALGNAWVALAPVLTARTAATGAVRASGLLDGAPPDLTAAWDRAAAPTVEPIPTSFQSMFRLMLDAVCDPGGVVVRVPSALGGTPAAGNLPDLAPERKDLLARVMVADPMVEKRS